MSVAQAKAALLQVGFDEEAERRSKPPITHELGKVALFGSLAAGLVGAVIGRGSHHADKHDNHDKHKPGRSAKSMGRAQRASLSLGLVFKLVRPFIPAIVRLARQHREGAPQRQAKREQAAAERARRAELRKDRRTVRAATS